MLITRLARGLLAAVTAGFAALAVVLAPEAILAAAALGLLAGLAGFSLATGDPDDPRTTYRRAVTTGGAAAGVTAVAVLTVAGMVAACGAAAAPLLLATALLAGPWAWPRLRPLLERFGVPHPAAATAPTPPVPEPLVEPSAPVTVLASVPTPALCARWHDTYHALHPVAGPPDQHRLGALIELRRCYLEEFEQRDPAGTARWMATEPRPAATGPHRHLSDTLHRRDLEPAPEHPPEPPGQP